MTFKTALTHGALATFAVLCLTATAQAQLFGPPRYPMPLLYGAPVVVYPAVAPVAAYYPPSVSYYPPAYPAVVQPVQVVQYAPPVTSFPVAQPTVVNYGSLRPADTSVYYSPTTTMNYAPTTYAPAQPAVSSPVTSYRIEDNYAPTPTHSTTTYGPSTVVYEGPPVYDGPASFYDAAKQRQEKQPINSSSSISSDDINGTNLRPLLVNPDTNETIRSPQQTTRRDPGPQSSSTAARSIQWRRSQ